MSGMTDDATPAAPDSCPACGRRTLLAGAAAAAGPAAAGSGSWVTVCRRREVPVGDALFFSMFGQPWVVTQPVTGVFKGFSARCTHEGGICNDVIRRAIQ